MIAGLQQTLETLYGLERRRSEFRVEDTVRALEALGRPHRRFRSVHVAGTNGKGSVCALVERTLRAAGRRTGLYTSPHLVDFRERIRVAGRWLPERELAERIAFVRDLREARGRTFFEIATLLGFDAFARRGVEWGVVEVGLGGRLDATNALEPEVSVVGSVALDHTEILGPTLAAVAREKAGIVKPGVPVVVGPMPDEAEAEVRAASSERQAPWIGADDRVRLLELATDADGANLQVEAPPWGQLALRIGLRGAHQAVNARVALAALSTLAERGVEIPAAAVERGFRAARWPGRLEPCAAEPRLWWDGAHNADAIARLVSAWRADLRFPPPSAVVFAASRDKDLAAMLSGLAALAPEATLFVAQTRNERAAPVERLAEAARAVGWEAHGSPGVPEAVRAALDGTAGRVLLAGSLFAVGEAMRAVGGRPGPRQ